MQVAWDVFTPVNALAGGLLLGLSAFLLMLFNGRIAGITGILGGLLRPYPGDMLWRWGFVVGVLLSPFAYRLHAPLPAITMTDSGWILAIAGLLVGYGTRLGAGCTSGHGICGNARFSMRSMVATITFMAAGVVIVMIMRHLLA